jgi:hypothetical protein
LETQILLAGDLDLIEKGESGTLSKYPGPEGPALDYPWKGLFYLKPYKLKVSNPPQSIGGQE